MEGKVIFLVIIGTASVMMMAFAVIYFVFLYKRRVLQNELEVKSIEKQYQEDMLNATLKSQESERSRLGSELHDSIGATLSSIKMGLQLAKRGDTSNKIDDPIRYLDEVIKQVRIISHQMMPIVLKKYGLKAALTDLFQKVPREKITAAILDWEDFELSDQDSLFLFRILQELTNNSLKHSNATEISVAVASSHETVTLTYSDNGIGYPDEVLNKAEGMGLLNIENRAQAIKAKAKFYNNRERGASVDLVFQLTNA